ncbi:hypothetical protein GCM10028895_29690 [Pontibacter rugosus]
MLAKDLFAHNRDLEQFAYIVSHNLRTPVANILGLGSLLSTTERHTQQFEKALSLLNVSTLQLDAVIKDLNNILSVRNHALSVTDETVLLSQVIYEVIESLRDRLDSCHASITIAVQENLKIKATKPYVYSIFYNLLSNSIKYRSSDRPLHISISLEEREEYSIIRFADNGIGIDLHKAGQKLFMLYKRFHSHVEGRGIGLYMVKNQAEAMGWSIKVNSNPGQGTEFQLFLNAHTA